MKIDVNELLDSITRETQEILTESGRTQPLIIGVHTGGVWIANALRSRLGIQEPIGELNIAFYRDDFSRIGLHPTVEPSKLPFDVNDRNLVLVDDILYTGRTVRAAMNEIFDYGRPASILLVTLVERGGRELPIRADVVGTRLNLEPSEHVKLLGPDPLRLEHGKAKI